MTIAFVPGQQVRVKEEYFKKLPSCAGKVLIAYRILDNYDSYHDYVEAVYDDRQWAIIDVDWLEVIPSLGQDLR